MNNNPNLLSLVLRLKLHPDYQSGKGKVIPRWWGRTAHKLLLDAVAQSNPQKAEELHNPQGGLRSFTVSSLIGSFPGGKLDINYQYSLRFTAIEVSVTQSLLAATQDGKILSFGAVVELDYIPFTIEAVSPHLDQNGNVVFPDNNSPWAGLTDFQSLSANHLVAEKDPSRRINLLFTSPTAFKSGGIHVPLPLPDLVFNSLLERWNAHSPVSFPDETRRFAAECLAVSRYRLSSSAVPIKSRGVRIGGKGKVTYTSINYDRYWMSIIHCLTEFSQFSGVGAGTAMGMGQCRARM